MAHSFRMVASRGTPVPLPANIAPYVFIVVTEARAELNSGYRGADAEALLNKYGHRSQRQLYEAWLRREPGANPANPPGFSTHEQRSDGAAYPGVPRGHDLPWWGVGFDVNDEDVERCIAVARAYHWELFRPYPDGRERHHLNFKRRPIPRSPGTAARIIRLRLTLPRG
jgi:hypothetical protein